MEWIETLGAIGGGTIIAALINVFIAQNFIEKRERRQWRREHILEHQSLLRINLLNFMGGTGELNKDIVFKECFASLNILLMLMPDEEDILAEMLRLLNRLKKERVDESLSKQLIGRLETIRRALHKHL